MRVILVDPASRKVTEGDLDGGLQSLQAAVGGGLIEAVYPGAFHPAFEENHGYVNEEGLFRADLRAHSWSLPGYPHLVGPGVLLSTDSAGNSAPCTMPLEVAQLLVRWT